MICRLCHQEVDRLVDSHLVPKAFFEYMKKISGIPRNGNLLGYTNIYGQFPFGKVWKGWSDHNILCLDCEKRLGPYDDYAIRLFLKEESEHKLKLNNEGVGYWEIDSYDFNKIKLFVISVLWRFSVSLLPLAKKVNLGSFEEGARLNILNDDPGSQSDFTFFISRYNDSLGKMFMLNPHPESRKGVFSGIRFYKFYLGAGYIVTVKVDGRPIPPSLEKIAVAEGEPMVILMNKKFKEKKESAVAKKLIDNAHKEKLKLSGA